MSKIKIPVNVVFNLTRIDEDLRTSTTTYNEDLAIVPELNGKSSVTIADLFRIDLTTKNYDDREDSWCPNSPIISADLGFLVTPVRPLRTTTYKGSYEIREAVSVDGDAPTENINSSYIALSEILGESVMSYPQIFKPKENGLSYTYVDERDCENSS